jgi:hypothetical protein
MARSEKIRSDKASRSSKERKMRDRSKLRVWLGLGGAAVVIALVIAFFPRSKAAPAPKAVGVVEAPRQEQGVLAPIPERPAPSPTDMQFADPGASRAEEAPMDRVSFNKRKADMTRNALNDVNTWIKYPLWSQPLTENMQYKSPTPFHGEHPGPGGAYPTLEFYTDKVNYAAGEPVKVIAVAHSKDGVIGFDALTGKTIGALKPRPEMTLDWQEQPDRSYVATLQIPADVARRNRGEWGINIDCMIQGEHRVGHNQFYEMVTDGKLVGPYRAALENGSLTVYATMNATAPGRFHLKGELWSMRDDPIAYAWVRADATPIGESTMKLVFYGKTIKDGGFDGPFRVKNLVLTQFEDDNERIVNDPVDPNLVTDAYKRTSFTDAPINGDNAALNEKKGILEGELKKAQGNGFDPNHRDPGPPTKASKDVAPPQ